jgi:hypothetical protein
MSQEYESWLSLLILGILEMCGTKLRNINDLPQMGKGINNLGIHLVSI